MGIESVSLIIAAFVNGSLGIAALMRNFRSRLCVSFAVLTGVLFSHDVLLGLASFKSPVFTSPRVQILTTMLAGPATLWFLRALVPHYQQRLKRVAGAYLFIVLLVLPVFFLPIYDRVGLLLVVVSDVLLLIPGAIWIYTLLKAEKVAPLNRERLRLRYAFWGGFLTLAIFLTNALHFAGFGVPPLGTMARTLYLIFIFQIFIQKELMTAEEVVAKMSLFGGVALMLSIIYSLLVSWVGPQPDLFFFNTFIASFVIIVLFDPIRSLSSKLTRKLFLRRNSQLEEELNRLSEQLLGNLEPLQLHQLILRALRHSLEIERSSTYLLERDGLSYFCVDPNSALSGTAEIPASDALIEYMTVRRGKPFVLETIENDRDSFHSAAPRKFCESCMAAMRKLGADFIIPFLQESKLVGFCAVSTGDGVTLSNEQLRLFMPVSRQIGFLLKNTQAFRVLRDRDKLAAVGEMAAGMAHEIKNPLGAIKGAAELLKGSALEKDPATGEFLQIILDESRRLSDVLTDFLDYAKPRRDYPQTKCDPLRVVEHTAAMVLRDKKLSVEISCEKEGITVEADPEILKQVLLNLFLNAIQAMEGFTGAPSLKVIIREIIPRRLFPLADSIPLYKMWEGWQALEEARDQSYLEIDVVDNGPGISAEDKSRIFVPFYTTKPKGTGLGLAICQRLIEGMGGTIQVKPNAPTGSIFTIHVPTRRGTAEKGNDFRAMSHSEPAKELSKDLAP